MRVCSGCHPSRGGARGLVRYFCATVCRRIAGEKAARTPGTANQSGHAGGTGREKACRSLVSRRSKMHPMLWYHPPAWRGKRGGWIARRYDGACGGGRPAGECAPGGAVGNVDWNGAHCRFCRFCILSFGVFSSQAANSRRFALRANLTFRVMGGKGGNDLARLRQEVATKWQGRWQKRQGVVGVRA
jgi:hypothetical protein